MPAPGGWPGALLAARQTAGERALPRLLAWSDGPQLPPSRSALRWPTRGAPMGPCALPPREQRSEAYAQPRGRHVVVENLHGLDQHAPGPS